MWIKINYPSILKILGWLLLTEAALMAIPLAVNIIEGQKILGFVLGIGGAGLLGGALTRFFHFDRSLIRRREGYLLVSVSWMVFSLFGMLPFIFCNTPLSVSDAFFETMSGFTTTGATTLADVEALSDGILLWRSMTQWVGGLGIILFMLALLPALNDTGGIPMYNAEVTGITHDKLHPRIRHTAMSLWVVYVALTLVSSLMLWAGPMDFFDALCQSMTAISTGGFSTKNTSIAWWDSDYVSLVTTLFMFLGGVNFSLIYAGARGRWDALWRNDVFRAYSLIVIVFTTMMSVSLAATGQAATFHDAVIAPLFHVVSTISTTGFTVADFGQWGNFTLLLTILLMLAGACAGSTTGAIKVDRLVALRHNLNNEIKLAINPRRVYVVRVNGNIMPPQEISRMTAFITIYLSLTLAGALILSAFGYDLTDCFFAVASCIGTNGLGYGLTGAAGGYHFLPDAAKWVMSFFMLIGRLELFSLLVLFFPYFWRK